ncbi:MAG TPA: acyltransferase [Candidatus Methylacidiphilales bacterium]|nr:acyltransferase [Candidatus Methylacidiphilales bacterium]
MTFSSMTLPEKKIDAPRQEEGKIKSGYLPHLDGLRALAILGVLSEHFSQQFNLALPDLLRCGPVSVRFFFVLTGYFITLSLWKVEAQMKRPHNGGLNHLGRYYLGRLLRIGPPFYLSLLVGAFFGIEEVRTNFFWLAIFQANNYIAYLGYFPPAISHYWSLAVQEQFYMLWPVVVLALPRRWFFPVVVGFIIFGLIFRVVCMVNEVSTLTRWLTIFGCIDSFAVGALVAWFKRSRWLEKMPLLPKTVLFALPLIAFGCFFLGRAMTTLPEGNIFLALTETCDEVFLAWLLVTALNGITSRYGQFLGWAPMVYLGKISYGIYVYHIFIIVLVSPLLAPYGLSEMFSILLLFAVTVIIASLSWHFFERPFLTWKAALSESTAKSPLAVGAF